MKTIHTIKQIVISERGGALILVFIGAIILSLTGVSMLRQSRTDYSISAHHYFDKTALFAADAGINEGIREMRNITYPPSVIINDVTEVKTPENKTVHFRTLYSGTIPETEAGPLNITGMQDLTPPMPAGQSVTSGLVAAGWNLTVTSRIYLDADDMNNNTRHKGRKEVQTMLITLAQMGH